VEIWDRQGSLSGAAVHSDYATTMIIDYWKHVSNSRWPVNWSHGFTDCYSVCLEWNGPTLSWQMTGRSFRLYGLGVAKMVLLRSLVLFRRTAREEYRNIWGGVTNLGLNLWVWTMHIINCAIAQHNNVYGSIASKTINQAACLFLVHRPWGRSWRCLTKGMDLFRG